MIPSESIALYANSESGSCDNFNNKSIGYILGDDIFNKAIANGTALLTLISQNYKI